MSKSRREKNAREMGSSSPARKQGGNARAKLASRLRAKQAAAFRISPAFTALLILALLATIAGGWLWRRRADTAAASAWDRPESTAEARLLQAALERPADGGAQAALGQHYLAAGRPFEALWALQRARDAAADGLELPMADALESVGLRKRALTLLSEAAAHHPADVSLALRRAELQLRLGQPAAALTTLRPFAAVPPTPYPLASTPSLALLFGRALEAAGDDAAALAQYRRRVPARGWAADPASAEARLRLGRLLVRTGQEDAGRAALEAAHRLNPTDPEPCFALGTSFVPEMAKDPGPAARWFSETLRVAPGYGPAHLALGQMALHYRRWKVAADQFEQAQRAGSQQAEALLGLSELLAAAGHPTEAHEQRGMAYAVQGKLPQALLEFQALKSAEPASRQASILISQVLIQMGRSAEAAVEVKAAADRLPRDPELKERLAQLYIDSLTRDEARHVCEEWRRMDPGAAKPLWLLGRTDLFSPRQLPRAIDNLERAARLAPQDPEILFALGEALSRSTPQQDIGRALELFGRAAELAPREAKYRYQLGLLLQQLDRPEPARRQFLRALDLDPAMTPAYAGLLRVSGKLREAGQIALFAPIVREQQQAKREETELRRVTYRSPADPAGYASLARCLAGRGDLKRARAQWEVVLSLCPGDAAARGELARLDRILGVL
jgi:tetratricopeptide (TPR) repeat protein